ncbi:hypothetical protein BZA77DRAFT_296433 [Pyronema omphalodes]|nr:hypothetical protein BZA77DRAFT_296433 [Pyronema omphalodes]
MPETAEKVDESSKSSTAVVHEEIAMDIPPAPRPRRNTITAALVNMGMLPVAASSLGGFSGNAVSAIFGSRPRSNSTIDPPSAGSENQQPSGDDQSTYTSQASGGGEEVQQGHSARSKPRSLSDYEASFVLGAAGVGGLGPMISADGRIFRRAQKSKDIEQEKQ